MNFKKAAFTFLVIAACVSSVELGKRLTGPRGIFNKLDVRDAARAKGNPRAPLWLTEYLDFQCSDCRAARGIVEQYLKAHPKDIYYQVRYLPLNAHSHSMESARAAECAARQKAFWEYEAFLFDNQPTWAPKEDPSADFGEYALQAGLDVVEWKRCVEDPSSLQAVETERDKAKALGLHSTPTFFIGDKQVVGSRGIAEELKKYFEEKK